MRVLQVSHAWAGGGSALYAAALADELRRQGVRADRFGPADVPGRRARGFGGSFADPAVEAAFTERVRGVDVVHVHHLSGLSLGLPALAAATGARVFVTLHDYWFSCARGQLVDAQGQRCVGPTPSRCAACLAPHLWAPVPSTVARRLPPREAPIRDREAAWAGVKRATTAFFAPSGWVARRLGVEAEVVPLPLLRPVPAAPIAPPGPLRVLFLGAWIPPKGPHLLLDAFSSLPAGAATLRMVGPSPPFNGSTTWATALRSRAMATPGVSVGGEVSHAAVIAEIHEADLLVLPSTWEENAPLVLGEALAAGLRVLASDVGGVREVAPEARLVEAGEVAPLRAALVDEVRRGRGRHVPVVRQSLAEHVATLRSRYGE